MFGSAVGGCSATDDAGSVSASEDELESSEQGNGDQGLGNRGISKASFLGKYSWQTKSTFVDFAALEIKDDGTYVAKVDSGFVDPKVRCVAFPCTLEETGTWNIYRSRVSGGFRLRVTPMATERLRYYELTLAEDVGIELRAVGREAVTVLARDVKNGGACVVSGCNGEICAASPMASACIWKEEFACYAAATCELGADGACGWKKTPELGSCLGE